MTEREITDVLHAVGYDWLRATMGFPGRDVIYAEHAGNEIRIERPWAKRSEGWTIHVERKGFGTFRGEVVYTQRDAALTAAVELFNAVTKLHDAVQAVAGAR